jgi:tetratricopeptide (TPR) repeat protein
MDYNAYVEAAEKGAKLDEQGDTDGALKIFKELAHSDLATTDRSVMCLNVAKLYQKKGNIDQALIWLEEGAGLESRHNGFFVAEARAAYLAELGRLPESLAAYEQLLGNHAIGEAAKLRIRQNIDILRKRTGTRA